MQIEIPDHLLINANLSSQDLKKDVAALMYKLNVFTMGQAAAFADIHKMQMQHELKVRNIYLNYDQDMLDNDFKYVNEP